MKIAVLALLYLAAPALMMPEKPPSTAENPATTTVIYKSMDQSFIPVSNDIPYVADDENCDEELVDFETRGEKGLLRYTMMRSE